MFYFETNFLIYCFCLDTPIYLFYGDMVDIHCFDPNLASLDQYAFILLSFIPSFQQSQVQEIVKYRVT